MNFEIRQSVARSILSPTSGFIKEAGFSHSLSPARNCTYGCTYCYVPTLGIYGGLKPEDWKRWGQFTTLKQNAAHLLSRELRPGMVIYCSPLVDPYQPADDVAQSMPRILEAVLRNPPAVFVIQTRSPGILRDLESLQALSRVTTLRVSFSLTTDIEEVRKLYEPHCASFSERVEAIRSLSGCGIETFATLAPLLPSTVEHFAKTALAASGRDLIVDPLHQRATKPIGATTREAAHRISERNGYGDWHDPLYQVSIIDRLKRVAAAHGRGCGVGVDGFSFLAQSPISSNNRI